MRNDKSVVCTCGKKAVWYTFFASGYVFICDCGQFILVDENFQNARYLR